MLYSRSGAQPGVQIGDLETWYPVAAASGAGSWRRDRFGWRGQWLQLATFVMMLLVLGACSSDDSDDGSDSPLIPPFDDGRLTFPLEVGNRWTFATEAGLRADAAGGDLFTTEVVGTRMIGGQSYACVIEPNAETIDTTYVRQSGSGVHLYPGFFLETRPPEDPIDAWLVESVRPTLPWKLIDFGAAADSSWMVADVEGQIELDLVVAQGFGSIEVTSLGTAPIATPAGTWTDAYGFRIRQTIRVISSIVNVDIVNIETVRVVDDLGVIWERQEQIIGGEPVMHPARVLSSFELQAP